MISFKELHEGKISIKDIQKALKKNKDLLIQDNDGNEWAVGSDFDGGDGKHIWVTSSDGDEKELNIKNVSRINEAKGDPVHDLKVAWMKSNKNNKIDDFEDWVEVMLGVLDDEGVKGPNKAYTYLFGTEFKYGVKNPAELALAFANYIKKVK